jgi:hypothetical protein
MDNMKNLLAFVITYVLCTDCFGQTFCVQFGAIAPYTRPQPALVGTDKAFDGNQDEFRFYRYEHQITRNSAFNLVLQHFEYKGSTTMHFKAGGYMANTSPSNPAGDYAIVGVGFGGTDVRRYDLGLSYNVLNICKRFFLSPTFMVGLQKVKSNGNEIYNIPITGPDYIENRPRWAEIHEGNQVVGTLGTSMGWLFWKRIGLYFDFQYTYAHHPFQSMYFDYKYKGVQQPLGVFKATGTSLLASVGVKYRFHKLIEVMHPKR